MSGIEGALAKRALFFGCWSQLKMGHYLYRPNGRSSYSAKRDFPGIPWDESLMDAGLLTNGKRPDVVDGKVFWTCGGLSLDCLWHAFFW